MECYGRNHCRTRGQHSEFRKTILISDQEGSITFKLRQTNDVIRADETLQLGREN
jgi:hypothetical protein